MVRLHPYNTRVQRDLGRRAAAHDNYMLDYWGLAFKQAADELRTQLARRRRASTAWAALGGGDLRAAVVGARWSWARNSKPPSTARPPILRMSLGTFYCRHLQVPILATVEREGVIYARVYDLRGARPEKLLTQPPP